MKTIDISQGYQVKVDDELHEWLMSWKWHYVNGYACRADLTSGKIPMHREICGEPPIGMIVDHINRDTLDNQKANLRFATKGQNCQNSRPRKNNSGYRGVFFHKSSGKYRVSIVRDHVTYNLGYFDNVADAAMTYDIAARELFGPNAATNFPAPITNFTV